MNVQFRFISTTQPTPFRKRFRSLSQTKQAPSTLFHFSQKAALEQANALLSVAIASKEEKERIAQLIAKFRFGPGFGKALNKLVRLVSVFTMRECSLNIVALWRGLRRLGC